MSKVVTHARDAVADVPDGATVMISGFGLAGQPVQLVEALLEQGAGDLTIVSNNAGNGATGIAALLQAGRVSRVVCSFPRQHDSFIFDELYRAGKVELELVPQGTLAERIRAGGAGIGGFYTRTGVGTVLGEDKEQREFNGQAHLLEHALRADIALISAYRADRWGNLVYRKTSRNFGPIMAAAASLTIAQVDSVVPLGAIDSEHIVTPGVYVDRVVAVGARSWLDNDHSVDMSKAGMHD